MLEFSSLVLPEPSLYISEATKKKTKVEHTSTTVAADNTFDVKKI